MHCTLYENNDNLYLCPPQNEARPVNPSLQTGLYGSGRTGQAAASWIAEFGCRPILPNLIGIRQEVHSANRRLPDLAELKMKKPRI